MRFGRLLATGWLGVALGAPAGSATPATFPVKRPAVLPPSITLAPVVALRGRPTVITISGAAERPSLEARAAGATANQGRPLPWTKLAYDGEVWRGVLPPPELRGVYLLELRDGPGSPVLRSDRWLLRVFPLRQSARPTFATPEDVARWWVKTLPSHPALVAMKRWPRPAFDRRDPRLHQLLVVAWSPAGRPAVRDRLGMFVTAVRETAHGRWSFLEATALP